jgi:hypothetical protein
MLPMRRIAVGMMLFVASVSLSPALWGQITAQPARPFNAAPPYAAGYGPTNYGPTSYGATNYSPPAMLSSLAVSPEANTIRGWYRDYLGRDVGQDLSALVNLMRGGMSPTDLQATILGSDEFYSQKGRDPQTFVRETRCKRSIGASPRIVTCSAGPIGLISFVATASRLPGKCWWVRSRRGSSTR